MSYQFSIRFSYPFIKLLSYHESCLEISFTIISPLQILQSPLVAHRTCLPQSTIHDSSEDPEGEAARVVANRKDGTNS